MKTAAWIAASLSLSLLAPAQADASSCSGGGSSGGSSSSSSSSSDWSSSDSSSDSGDSSSSSTRCVAAHLPVGLRDCGVFGGWSAPTRLPRFVLGFGVAMRQAPSSAGNRTGHVTHENESFTYRTVDGGGGGGGAATDTTVLSTIRFGFGLPRPFYAAVDLELGGVASPGPSAEMTSAGQRGSPTISKSSAFAFNALGVVGARTGARRHSLALEVAGGMRSTHYSFQSNYLACETFTTVGSVDPLVEIRASAERWLNPWMSVGAVAGGSVIDRGAWMTGIYLGLHSRAFAGER